MPNSLLVRGYNLLRHATRDLGVSAKRSNHWPTVEKHFRETHPKCQVCGDDTRLQVHHKQPFHLKPELELDPSNLISLCMGKHECHLLIGHGDDFHAYNPEVEKDARILSKDLGQFDKIAERAKTNRKYNV